MSIFSKEKFSIGEKKETGAPTGSKLKAEGGDSPTSVMQDMQDAMDTGNKKQKNTTIIELFLPFPALNPSKVTLFLTNLPFRRRTKTMSPWRPLPILVISITGATAISNHMESLHLIRR